jgi:DNA-binding MarR family transcriptional regulator
MEKILMALRGITSATDRRSRELVRDYGLTGPQIGILNMLSRTGAISVGTLARDVSLSPGTVTGIIDRLEAHGFVRRDRSESDKRRVLVHLTPKGTQTVKDAPFPLNERFVKAFNELEEWEQGMLVASLQRLAAMMNPEHLHANETAHASQRDNEPVEAGKY